MKLRFVILFGSLFIACYSQKAVRDQNATDKFIEHKMNKSGIPGLAAAIIVDKKMVWCKGYGYADKENKVPFTPATIINIASITKTITGACLMHAVETNKVSLDADINSYLPFKVINPNYQGDKITLRNLATHTSGIVDQEAYSNSYQFGGDAKVPLAEFLKDYFSPDGKYYKKENFKNTHAGSYYEYSNIGAALAGYIIEVATGEPLTTYSRHFIFDPLKMDHTSWFMSETAMSNHSKLYYKEGDKVQLIDWYGLITYPDGGVRTSVTDLSTFFTCLLHGGEQDGVRILRQESVDAMFKAQFTTSTKPDHMNLADENSGIFLSIENDGAKTGHDGEDPGVNTEMYYDHTKQVGLILFVNLSADDEEIKAIRQISGELWKYALTVKRNEDK